MNKLTATLQEWNEFCNQERNPVLKEEKRFFLSAKTAMGNGSREEQLIRLMVWIAAKHVHLKEHSLIKEPFAILRDGRAWCDQQCKLFIFFAKHLLDVSGRFVSLKHCDGKNSHTVAEVFYDNSWHLYDMHGFHQSIYRSGGKGHILSYAEICADNSIVASAKHWWKGHNSVGKEGFYTKEFPAKIGGICADSWMLLNW